MVKNMTKRLFGVIVLMMLMMATSLSAHADFYLIGSFNEWNQDTKLAMTQDADGYWTITKEFAANEEFKFIDGGTWVGAQSNNEITADVLNKGTAIKLSPDGGALNLKVMVAGTYTIVFDATGSTNGENYNMRMGVKAPVSVMANIANGQVTVNKEAAIPGETVRITVKPSGGYYIERNNITVEKTIGGGQAQNPGPKEEGPGVGSFVDVEGNPMNSVDLVNEYRFAMPESPYGAKVSAEFQACTAITSVDAIDDQTYTGSAIEPAVVVKAGETTLGEGDYTVEYSNNTAVGQATVIVTGKGKYTGTLTVNFNIVKAKHNITIATGIENGSVTPSVTEAVEGDPVTLTVAPAAGYEVGEVYYMNGEEKVVIENNSFVMPDFDVEINATFTAIGYTITIDDKIVNGTVEADKATANVGEKVTLTATPDVDCEFAGFTVMAGETAVAVADDNTFIMPASDVTVSATFNALPVTYVIKWGIGSNWETVNDIALTKGDDKKWSTAAGTELDANAQFKVVRVVEGSGPEWYGKDFTVTTLPATIENLTNADNTPNIKFSKAGTYSFSYDPATKTLVVSGEFAPEKYAITVAEGITGGTVTPSVTEAAAGETVTLTVTPAAGYEVGEVYYMNGEEKVVIENNSFVMPDFDVEINATFTAIGYTITIDDKIVNGTVEADKATANVGEKVTLTATPDVDCEFAGFTVMAGETAVAVADDNTFIMPASDVTVSATFNALPVTYVIKWGIGSNWETVNDIALTKGDDKKWSTAAGTELDANAQFKVVRVVEGSGPEWYGKDFTVTTLPATIENLTNADNTPNIKFSKAGTYSFSYDPATKTLVVSGEFAPEKYAITVAEGITGGSVVPDKTEAAEGEKVTLTITPATGYELETLTVMMGETPVTVAEDNTFTMPAGNVVVSATFKKTLVTSQLTWTVTPAEGGTVVVKAGETTLEASPAEVLQTTVVTVTATPNENYELDAITVMSGETEITLGEGNTFEMPAADVAITVTFKAVEYDLEGVMFTAERQWATYYNGTKNLALPEGVKAYVVNSVVNDAVDITEINYIPAGVGVLLYSENAAEQVFTTIYTGETATYTSKLVGSDEAQEIAASAGYILYNNVFTLSEGGAVAAHRCYLPVNVTTNAPRVLRIGYDGSVTAIETLIATGNVASVKYVNLSGVTSSMPFRGINIAVITFTDGTTRTVKVIK